MFYWLLSYDNNMPDVPLRCPAQMSRSDVETLMFTFRYLSKLTICLLMILNWDRLCVGGGSVCMRACVCVCVYVGLRVCLLLYAFVDISVRTSLCVCACVSLLSVCVCL